jgi:hypothetical protein
VVELSFLRRWLIIMVVLVVFTAAGCAATVSTPKAVTDVKQLVGVWEGWIGCHGCPERWRARLSVRDDGYYELVTQQNRRLGKFRVAEGQLQHGSDGHWWGYATLVEERGREWLTLRRANGDIYTEFYRDR